MEYKHVGGVIRNELNTRKQNYHYTCIPKRLAVILLSFAIFSLTLLNVVESADGDKPAYGVHIVSINKNSEVFGLAVFTDDQFAFRTWRIDLYGQESSSYNIFNMITGELLSYGNFSYHTNLELKFSGKLISVSIEIDGIENEDWEYERIRLKRDGNYNIRDEDDTNFDRWGETIYMTYLDVKLLELKVMVASIVLAVFGFFMAGRAVKDKKENEVVRLA